MENKLEKDKMLLTQASDAWQSVELFRRRRRRYKDFAYGRQWSDTIRDTQGRIVSEEQDMLENGRFRNFRWGFAYLIFSRQSTAAAC